MNAADTARAMHAAKADIDEALDEWRQRIEDDAIADDEMRRAMARAYLTTKEQIGPKATVAQVQAAVDLETAELQKRARRAEGLKRTASKAVESKMQWLQSLMSLASLTKAEANLARWEPAEVRSA